MSQIRTRSRRLLDSSYEPASQWVENSLTGVRSAFTDWSFFVRRHQITIDVVNRVNYSYIEKILKRYFKIGRKNASALSAAKRLEKMFGILDLGGDFKSTKDLVATSRPYVDWKQQAAANLVYRYIGRLWANGLVVTSTSPYPRSTLTDAELFQRGGHAIASVAPTNPAFNGAQQLGELREALDLRGSISLVMKAGQTRNALDFLKVTGALYLGVEFGLNPLRQALKDLTKVQTKVMEIVKQFERDAGKPIRRRYDFPEETSTVTEVIPNVAAVPGPSFPMFTSQRGTLTKTTVTKRLFWFSGSFVYRVDFGDSLRSNLSRFEQYSNKVLGSRLTPEVIWELSPWSWLIDWFVNVGDLYTNLTRFTHDGLVMKYGYIMCKERIVTTYTLEGIVLKDGTPVVPIVSTFITEVKNRKKASPFGFGLNPNSFSKDQWAILVALGITKAPGSLEFIPKFKKR